MSQAGIINPNNSIGATTYNGNTGHASPVAGVLDIVGTGINSTSSAGGTVSVNSILQFAEITLTSAQIKSLNSAPVTMIAAPGANKQIVVVSGSARYIYGGNTTFLTGSGFIGLNYTSFQALESMDFFPTADLFLAADNLSHINGNNDSTIGQLNNAPLVVSATSDITGNATGDNTIKIQIIYWISDLN